jgi:hypothetical protein
METRALPQITQQDATDEAPTEQLFHEPQPPAFPASVITIQAVSADGFPVTITLNDPASGALSKWLELLTARGFRPAAGGATSPAANANAAATGEAPACPVHAPRKMKRSNFGGWFCTWSDQATGEKCNQKIKE